MLSQPSWQTHNMSHASTQLPPHLLRSEMVSSPQKLYQRRAPSIGKRNSPSHHRESSPARARFATPSKLKALLQQEPEIKETLKPAPGDITQISQPAPELLPPIAIISPLRVPPQFASVESSSPTKAAMDPTLAPKPLFSRPFSELPYKAASTTNNVRQSSGNERSGSLQRPISRESVPFKPPTTLRLEAKRFSNKPLPATPSLNTKFESPRPPPTQTIDQCYEYIPAGVQPDLEAYLLENASYGGAVQSPYVSEPDSSNTLTMVRPEQTAWRHTAYVPGPILVQTPGGSRTEASSPRTPGGLGLYTSAPSSPFDLFNSVVDDGSSIHTKRSEETTLGEVAEYIEDYGFEPVAYTADQFWHDDDGTRSNRSGSVTSADLSFCYRSSAYYRDPGSGTTNTTNSSGTPERQLWSSIRPMQRKNSFMSRYSENSPRISFQSSVSSVSSSNAPRHLPPSPATSHHTHKTNSMTERERKATLKKMGSASSVGPSRKISFMRLVKGAGSIV